MCVCVCVCVLTCPATASLHRPYNPTQPRDLLTAAEVIRYTPLPALIQTDEKTLIESVAGISPVPLSVHPDLKQTIIFNW